MQTAEPQSVARPVRARWLLTTLLVAGGVACGQPAIEGAPGSGGAAGRGGGGAGGIALGGAGGVVIALPDAALTDACVPAIVASSCASRGGSYCGVIGDGCGSTIDCGNDCPAGWTCDLATNVCVGGADCRPTFECSYTAGGSTGSYCGKISDGCGHALDCGDKCSTLKPGWVCDRQRLRRRRRRVQARHLLAGGGGALLRPGWRRLRPCPRLRRHLRRPQGRLGMRHRQARLRGRRRLQEAGVRRDAERAVLRQGRRRLRRHGRLRRHLLGLQGRLGMRRQQGPVRGRAKLHPRCLHGRGRRPILRRHRRRLRRNAPVRRLPGQRHLRQ